MPACWFEVDDSIYSLFQSTLSGPARTTFTPSGGLPPPGVSMAPPRSTAATGGGRRFGADAPPPMSGLPSASAAGSALGSRLGADRGIVGGGQQRVCTILYSFVLLNLKKNPFLRTFFSICVDLHPAVVFLARN